MDLKEKLRKFVLEEQKLDFFGVASVDRFKYAPEEHKPETLLTGAKSVISIGTRILEGVREAMLKAQYKSFPRHLIYSYLWYGYSLLNWIILDRTAYLVANLLEKEGYAALPVPSSGAELRAEKEDTKRFGQFSNRHAAVAAGLAEFGLNRLALNPVTGPRARWVSVITTAELEPDPLYNGPKLCRPDLCAKLCKEKFGVKKPMCHYVCPVNAFLTEKMEKVIIGDKVYYYPDMNMVKCMWALSLGSTSNIITVPENVKTFKDIDREIAKYREPIVQKELVYVHGASYCGRCINLCPSPDFKFLPILS